MLLQIPEVDPNVSDSKRNSLLNIAAALDNSKCVELLTTVKGLDWNPRNMNDETPILIAMRENRTDMVKIMMNCSQVDVSVTDDEVWHKKSFYVKFGLSYLYQSNRPSLFYTIR